MQFGASVLDLKGMWQTINKSGRTGSFSFVVSDHFDSGGAFFSFPSPSTPSSHLSSFLNPRKLRSHTSASWDCDSVWFYGSRSSSASSAGMLNGMAVCLMKRFKTRVSPWAVPSPHFYCLLIPVRLWATITASFRIKRVDKRHPGRWVRFPVRKKRKHGAAEPTGPLVRFATLDGRKTKHIREA